MRAIASYLLILFSMTTVMLFAHAEHNTVVNTKDNSINDIQGVYIQAGGEHLLKTTNQTYVLIDKQKILDTKTKGPALVLESFRICITGQVVPYHTIAPNGKYSHALLVKKLCDS